MSRLIPLSLVVLSLCYYSNGQYYPGGYYGSPYGGGYGGGGYFGGTNDGDGGFGALSQFGGFDLVTARRVRFAHGVVSALAFVVFFPVGAIAIRIIPGRFALFIHALFQLFGLLLYTIGFGMGIWLIREIRFGSFNLINNKHPIIGIVVFAFLLFQPILGVLHHLGFKKHGRRTIISQLHIWIGRLVVTVGIVNGGLGLQLAANSRSGDIIYAVVAGIFWFVWMLAACFGEVRRATKRKHHERNSPHGSVGNTREVTRDPVATGARGAPVAPKTTADSYA